MNPPSIDIKDMITQSDGVGTFPTDVFVSEEPVSPDACVTIMDTGGFDPETHTAISKPTVQIRVRGNVNGYREAFVKAQVIVGLLDGLANEVWNGARYIHIFMMGDINSIGGDENRRPILTMNFMMERT